MKTYYTVKELKEKIGQYVVSEAKSSWSKNEKIVWMQKLTRIPSKYKDNDSTKHISVFGSCVMELSPNTNKVYGLFFNEIENYSTNAQDFFRDPTKEEMNQYRNIWRKYRIFKKIE